ncbi:hypothetical protein MF672_035935 [Actinomadura sp. ATCC 31491]|uniref:MFS transporter n=1 Tax=Actinomadura luzonensis TaxID=2805427 RepID=A0ABT0G4M8_9ACTN|nr:hypothetical protein [Actinomadura luzonensis]MCK2219150.1 hypothetical protein [Actinomadura luzonensis]
MGGRAVAACWPSAPRSRRCWWWRCCSSGRTWRRDEQTTAPPAASFDGGPRARLPLAQARLWHGGAPVWRLRVVHVSFATASVGLAVAGPFAGTRPGLVLTAANAAVQAAAAVLVVLPWIGRRLDPHAGAAVPAWLGLACRALRLAAGLALAATAGAALAGLGPGEPGGSCPASAPAPSSTR